MIIFCTFISVHNFITDHVQLLYIDIKTFSVQLSCVILKSFFQGAKISVNSIIVYPGSWTSVECSTWTMAIVYRHVAHIMGQ